MDTLIFVVIFVAFLGLMRRWSRRRVLGLWAVALVAALLLFDHHVTSDLDLNF